MDDVSLSFCWKCMQQCFINYTGQTKHYFACDVIYVCSVLNALLITYTLAHADSVHKACMYRSGLSVQ